MNTTAAKPSLTGPSEVLTVLSRIFDEGFATGNGVVADELCSPDLVEHQFGLSGNGGRGDPASQGRDARRP